MSIGSSSNLTLTELQQTLSVCPPQSQTAQFPHWNREFRALAEGISFLRYYDGVVDAPVPIPLPANFAQRMQAEQLNDTREARYNKEKSTAYALLRNALMQHHKELVTVHTHPWTLYASLLAKFNFVAAHALTALELVMQRFYSLTMPDDLTIDNVEDATTTFLSQLEESQISANALVANSIDDNRLILQFKGHCSILKTYIADKCITAPNLTLAQLRNWLNALFSNPDKQVRARLLFLNSDQMPSSALIPKATNSSQANAALQSSIETESKVEPKAKRQKTNSQANAVSSHSNNNNRGNNSRGGNRGGNRGNRGRNQRGGRGFNRGYNSSNNFQRFNNYGNNHNNNWNNQQGFIPNYQNNSRNQYPGRLFSQGRSNNYYRGGGGRYNQNHSQGSFHPNQANFIASNDNFTHFQPFNNPNDSANFAGFTGAFHSFSPSPPPDSIIVDSGSCNTHIRNLNYVSNFQAGKNVIEVSTASGDRKMTQGTGYIGPVEAHLTPDFAAELLSVSSLVDMKFIVTFDEDLVIITHKITGDQYYGTRVGQLWYFPKSILQQMSAIPSAIQAEDISVQQFAQHLPQESANLATTKPRSDFITWHARLHLSYDHISKLSRENHVLNLRFRSSPQDSYLSNCLACAQAKLRRKSYKKTRIISPAELLIWFYTDVKGPLHPLGVNGEKYVVAFICALSKFKWVYFLKTKDAVAEAFKKFIDEVVLPSRKPVPVKSQKPITFCLIVSDGGGEYQGQFEECCRNYGYLHETTPPYTPELNGLSENYWRTLFGTVRAFIFENQSTVPLFTWPYALKYANLVLNRTLLVSHNGVIKTPYEWLFQTKPDLSSIKVWGTQCFVPLPKGIRSNTSLGHHGLIGYFVGFNDKGLRTAVVMVQHNGVKFINADFGGIIFNEIITSRRNINNGEEVVSSIHGLIDFSKYLVFQSSGTSSQTNQQVSKRPRIAPVPLPQAAPTPSHPVRMSARLQERLNRHQALAVKKQKPGEVPFDEAMNGPNREDWKQAIKEELYAMEANNVWTIVPRPNIAAGFTLLGLMFVLKQKFDLFGEIQRFKARLCILGNNAKKGIDYDETYAPVSKIASFRIFFSIVVQLCMYLFQLDFDTAFLNAFVDTQIYANPPPYVHLLYPNVDWTRYCLMLNKALYGLPQAPLLWFRHVDAFLKGIGYEPISTEPCLYRINRPGYVAFLILYVDDMVIACSSLQEMHHLVSLIETHFKIKKLGTPTHLLGLRVKYDREAGYVSFDATHKIDSLLEKLGMQHCAFEQLPMNPTVKLSANPVKPDGSRYPDDLTEGQKSLYRSIVGAVMFIMLTTRPDIAFAVTTLARFLSNPLSLHLAAAKHLVRYLRFTREYALEYRRMSWLEYIVRAYSDSDWGANLDTRRSHTGGAIFLGIHLIIWMSNIQPTVSLSSAEAEVNALKEVVKFVLWVRRMLEDFNIFQNPLPVTPIYEDNQAALQIAMNPEVSKRNRHFDMAYHFIRENIADFKTIKLIWIDSINNWADLFTKALAFDAFYHFITLLFTRFVHRQR